MLQLAADYAIPRHTVPFVQSRPRAGKIALSRTAHSSTGCATLRPALAVKATFVHTQRLPLSAHVCFVT